MEVMALLFGLRLIHSKGLYSTPIVMEGDSANVIRWIKNESPGPWRLFHLLKEVAFLVSSLNISFRWIPREANEVIDGLAKRGVDKEDVDVGSSVEEM